jgi:hypothetical protein
LWPSPLNRDPAPAASTTTTHRSRIAPACGLDLGVGDAVTPAVWSTTERHQHDGFVTKYLRRRLSIAV